MKHNIIRTRLERYVFDKKNPEYIDFSARLKQVNKAFDDFAETLKTLGVGLSNPNEEDFFCVNIEDLKSKQWVQSANIQKIIPGYSEPDDEIVDFAEEEEY